MTTPGPAKPMVDLLRGPGPRDYTRSETMGAILTSINQTTGANTVSDGAVRYANLESLVPYAQLVVGRVVLLKTPGLPLILGNVYKPTA